MKKTLAYVSTAILLGFAIMMLPKTIETQLMTTTQQGENMTNEENMTNRYSVPSDNSFKSTTAESTFYGLGVQPTNLLPSGLILISGLIAALSVYAVTRKRLS
jgi:hypothetical protein